MERKTYKNVIENRKYIIFALAEIMRIKPFHEIAVTEVCKKAGISKNTFYRHFDSLSDVIYKAIGEINTEMVKKYEHQTNQTAEEFILYTCYIWYENRELYLGFTQDETVYIIKEMIKKDIENFLESRKIENNDKGIYCEFFSTVFSMFLCWWCKNNFSVTPETLAKQIKCYLCGNVLERIEAVL